MYDDIGSVQGLVDASGVVTDTYELDTFGHSVSSSRVFILLTLTASAAPGGTPRILVACYS